MDTVAFLAPLLSALRQTIPMVVREQRPSGDYLEGVLARHDVARCCELLCGTLGEPAKDFGKDAKLDRAIQKAVDAIGGIRTEQCLFAATPEPQRLAYATLWPWASDSNQVTLKVGILELR